ncbi:MAG: helix-turn-helix domain-containing protein [Marinifilaceae bacterium]
MSYREYINRMELLVYLIDKESTGTAQELANRLCVSRRTVFGYLSLLKDDGRTIRYSRKRRTYYFM